MRIPHEHKEIEIKIQLHRRSDYEHVAAWLQEPQAIIHQHDWFFDGPNNELAKNRAGMRVRFLIGAHGESEAASLTHKAGVELEHGISTAQETEEIIKDIDMAHRAVTDPNSLLEWDTNLVNDIKAKYHLSSLKCLGGYKTLRKVYNWDCVCPTDENDPSQCMDLPVKIELDETVYLFGTKYEIEIETLMPEQVKQQLLKKLDELKVNYRESQTTKLEDLVRESLL